MCQGPEVGTCEEASKAAGERARERMAEDGRRWTERRECLWGGGEGNRTSDHGGSCGLGLGLWFLLCA